jgi:hypothetical protein
MKPDPINPEAIKEALLIDFFKSTGANNIIPTHPENMKPNEPMRRSCKSCGPRKITTLDELKNAVESGVPLDVVIKPSKVSHKPTHKISVSELETNPKKWICKRCGANVVNGRCKCETSPSPWVPAPTVARVTIPDERVLYDVGRSKLPADTDKPQWNPPWAFIVTLLALILTILYYATK